MLMFVAFTMSLLWFYAYCFGNTVLQHLPWKYFGFMNICQGNIMFFDVYHGTNMVSLTFCHGNTMFFDIVPQ